MPFKLDNRQLKAKQMSNFLQFLDGMISTMIDQGDVGDKIQDIVSMYDSPEILKEALESYIYEYFDN